MNIFPFIILNSKKLIFKKLLSNNKVCYRCSLHSSKNCKANFHFISSEAQTGTVNSYIEKTPHSCENNSPDDPASESISQPPSDSSQNLENNSQIYADILADLENQQYPSEIFESPSLNSSNINRLESQISPQPTSEIFSQNHLLTNQLSHDALKNNITKPLSFHVYNFLSLGLSYTYNQIKWSLQKLRSHIFPIDKIFLENPFLKCL